MIDKHIIKLKKSPFFHIKYKGGGKSEGYFKFTNQAKGLSQAVDRYPLTMLFLFATLVINATAINDDGGDYSKYIFTFIIGAFISAVGQHVYERFFTKRSERLLLMGGRSF
ncbi:hypothetical protein ACI2OX_17190 [Bacillus sp. N9]